MSEGSWEVGGGRGPVVLNVEIESGEEKELVFACTRWARRRPSCRWDYIYMFGAVTGLKLVNATATGI